MAPVTTGPQSEGFEWVQYGDPLARPRARAHITRGFRRRKAEEARQASLSVRSKLSSAVTSEQNDPVVSHLQGKGLQNQPRVALVEAQEIMVQRTLRSYGVDPFGTLPIKLNSNTHAILDHFALGFVPYSYTLKSAPDFSSGKFLSLKISQMDVAAFHTILAIGAADLAALRGKPDSEDALMHRGIAMRITNKRLLAKDTKDGTLACVILLAGYELVLGTVKAYNVHINGLVELVCLRGGLTVIQKTSPLLYALLSWMDYAGSCNLVSRRKLLSIGPISHNSASDPIGVPEGIMRSLPVGYDFLQRVHICFDRLETLTGIVSDEQNERERVRKISTYMRQLDEEFYQVMSKPDISGNRSRRQYLEQISHLALLLLAAILSSKGAVKFNQFLGQVQSIFVGKSTIVGRMITDSCYICFSDTATITSLEVEEAIDALTTVEWPDARKLKLQLLECFLGEGICAGELQTLWRKRLGDLMGPDYQNMVTGLKS